MDTAGQWEFKVRVSGGAGRATAYARRCSFTVGAPVSFDERHPGPTAIETLLGALGAEAVNGLSLLARERRAIVDRVEAKVRGELEDPFAALGVIGAQGSPALKRAEVTVYAETSLGQGDLENLFRDALARSPIVQTLGKCVVLDMKVHPA